MGGTWEKTWRKRRQTEKHPHQIRIPKDSLKKSKEELLKVSSRLKDCQDFDALHNLVYKETEKIHRIGELTVYDTAYRIGIKLNKFPTKVYLHADPRKGAKALYKKGFNAIDYKGEFVEVKAFPKEFNRLKEPYEIENCLCICKEALENCKN